ncbi:MAG: hypothetical protein IJK38_05960 [Oscillospiraceae bacterium]|nr:hypothetical protein [Oscillospiraceae bacterium]
MMKRIFSLIMVLALAFCMIVEGSVAEEADLETLDDSEEEETLQSEKDYPPVDYQHLRVANPTPLTGHFFTSMWGASTSDLDVQELLHRYKLVVYDNDLGRYRMNHLVVTGAVTQDDEDGNRTYYIAIYDDLEYSDGTPITAWDYAFTMLLMIDPAVKKAGGIPSDESWILGEEEYLSGASRSLSGIRIIDDHLFSVTVKSEALPYFYELSRFRISPYPIQEIAPGCRILDDGEGVYLTPGLTGDILKRTVLDSYNGYMTAPKAVSGPYTIDGYKDGKAHFVLNTHYKGNQKGETPAIPELTYGGASSEEIISMLESGELGLVNKVMNIETIQGCMALIQKYPDRFRLTSYPRTGLTVLRFMPKSLKVQETAVRQAVFYCLDRESIVQDYTGGYGMPVKGLYGIGQWMVRLISGPSSYPIYINEETATAEEIQAYEQELEQWQSMNMSSIREYSLDVEEAIRLLEESGWTLNRYGDPYDGGIRYSKMADGRLIGLDMKVLIPANMREVLGKHWKPYMEAAGIGLELIDADIWQLDETYRRDSIETYDMVIVGEDFSDRFRLNGAYAGMEQNGSTAELLPLEELNDRIEAMSVVVYHTDKLDLQEFERKWLDLQIEVAETVPVIPLYSNVYIDFYEAELLGYRVENYLGWGNAIVAAWLGNPEAAEMERE